MLSLATWASLLARRLPATALHRFACPQKTHCTAASARQAGFLQANNTPTTIILVIDKSALRNSTGDTA